MSNISVVSPHQSTSIIEPLSKILADCVNEGASVGFIEPFDLQASRNYWQTSVIPNLEKGDFILLVAEVDGEICGCVFLDLAMMPNQVHRAGVGKLLVDPKYRGKGLARALMIGIEQQALNLGKSLLVLDTKTGDKAEQLYLSLGYQSAGCIPNFAKDPSGNTFASTTYMYKHLS